MEEIKKDQTKVSEQAEKPQKGKIAQFLKRPLSKKTKIILLILLIVLGGLFAYGIYILPLITPGDYSVGESEKKPEAVCPLTGVYVTQEVADTRPFGIMIENNSVARPQSGLDKADLVYEVVTEGGITRFLAFYECQTADVIGPVRSSRIYYLDWVQELKAFYVHAGGSPDSLVRIQQDGVLDLKHVQNYFWRSSARSSPHNLYTSIEKLRQYAESKKYDLKKSDFVEWKFKDDAKKADRPESASVKIHFSSASYLVEYVYNSNTNDWTRKIAGVLDKDLETGEPIKVKNVVVQFAQITKRADGRVDVGNIGSGDAVIFVDGKASLGTWKKATATSRNKFYDSAGKEIEFSRGSTWVEVVNLGTTVEY